jgi:hypothetical protein
MHTPGQVMQFLKSALRFLAHQLVSLEYLYCCSRLGGISNESSVIGDRNKGVRSLWSLEMILTPSFCQTPTLEEAVQRTKVDADISPVIIHLL